MRACVGVEGEKARSRRCDGSLMASCGGHRLIAFASVCVCVVWHVRGYPARTTFILGHGRAVGAGSRGLGGLGSTGVQGCAACAQCEAQARCAIWSTDDTKEHVYVLYVGTM